MIRALRFAALAALFLGVSFGAGVIILFAWVAAAVELPTLIVEASDPGANASAVERTIAAPIEQQVNGVEHLRHQPCLVVCLGQANGAPADRERLIREIRREMHQTFVVAGQVASVRMRDLSGAPRSRRFGYPIDFAICGPEHPRAQELAGQLVVRMSQEPGLTDVWADLRTAPSLEPSHLERINLFPAVSITATPAEGVTQADARSACERLAAEVLPKQQPTEYRLVWLRAPAR